MFFGVSDIYWNPVLLSRPIGSTAGRWALSEQYASIEMNY